MFHDRKMVAATQNALAFELNADACKLMLLVDWYRARGERVLPVQYLKRLGFTRRQWELATKGHRPYEGRRLKDHAPAKDGLEFFGYISEHRDVDEETGIPKTYWIIGEVDQEALDQVRRQRQEAAFDVIDEPAPIETPEEGETVEPSTVKFPHTSEEDAYNAGYADGERAGYSKGVRDLDAVMAEKPAVSGQPSTEVVIQEAAYSHPELIIQATCEALQVSCVDLERAVSRIASERHLGF